MTLDNENQRKVLMHALTEAGFAGVDKLLVGIVTNDVRTAQIVAPEQPAPEPEP